jgi:ATP-dependent RNA helicase DHX37/DHR1
MIGQQHGCLPYIIAIVSTLSVGDVFVQEQQLGFSAEEGEDDQVSTYDKNISRDTKSKIRSDYYRAHANFASLDAESDTIKLLTVVCAFVYEKNPGFLHW